MPPQDQPIDFENAEGNLGWPTPSSGISGQAAPVAIAARPHRFHGAFATSASPSAMPCSAYGSLKVGLGKLELDTRRLAEDLERAWEVLGEAVQTVMRSHGSRTPMIASSDLPAAGPLMRAQCANSSVLWSCRRRQRAFCCSCRPASTWDLPGIGAPHAPRRLTPWLRNVTPVGTEPGRVNGIIGLNIPEAEANRPNLNLR